MDKIFALINENLDYISLFILGLFILAFFYFIYITIKLNKTKKMYEDFLSGMETKNIEEIILTNSERISSLENDSIIGKEKIREIELNLEKTLQNVVMQRYNAFQGIGGEQSFSLAILDKNGTGIVISSIHSREEARTYAKSVENGISKFHLSEEEMNVLAKALKKK